MPTIRGEGGKGSDIAEDTSRGGEVLVVDKERKSACSYCQPYVLPVKQVCDMPPSCFVQGPPVDGPR